MASEDMKMERKLKTKTNRKKKAKKDKWGQPILSEESQEKEQVQEEEAAEEEKYEEEDYNKNNNNYYSNNDKNNYYEPNKVVVSGMPYSTTEEEIRELFEEFGAIDQLQLSRFPDSGNFRGLAFLTFQTEAATKRSLELDGKKMGNRFLRVERCRGDPQRKRKSEFLSDPKKVEGSFSVYVGNLSWDVTEDDIRECFEESEIVSIRFACDKNTGDFRGFGHIDFKDDESLEAAMKKNQSKLHGRPMKIAYAVSNRD